ncbi:hypothetical protein A2X44_02270 [candidate division CPR3 bacterium GWF2_35_18]|uniref:Uncharacterized protein n=1 Tax=candidate division CPR3 bacterium GW2011_GWF2_35_18 TaxID=1618350 RepID=A0A0G0ERM4_UNCC3|nr:MAG: hypothetical protein UR67_C0002G0137 [candidate division CPR3 bacterium GW2011_GWF2_35_18]KKP86261.1 MAG: hypothetical protein UR87_C0024G0005 [candidate division CPR3 bacterium GW2011_GWE2_35_7]OGB62822.1 MAG: hypothetical protein A2X44_02270 [candidate division CPR3 bacterium GWF2_35_18]OGB65403.1 MAG: hypothetical protein A2250_00485 [candidate division CPR3 bacterium RIFOXYA2_FULL_35_13]OGB76854.1 MAG: hypothetical protein A2476_04265 [candidate division CPR3 bacterium RIFOXYC2_FULL
MAKEQIKTLGELFEELKTVSGTFSQYIWQQPISLIFDENNGKLLVYEGGKELRNRLFIRKLSKNK